MKTHSFGIDSSALALFPGPICWLDRLICQQRALCQTIRKMGNQMASIPSLAVLPTLHIMIFKFLGVESISGIYTSIIDG